MKLGALLINEALRFGSVEKGRIVHEVWKKTSGSLSITNTEAEMERMQEVDDEMERLIRLGILSRYNWAWSLQVYTEDGELICPLCENGTVLYGEAEDVFRSCDLSVDEYGDIEYSDGRMEESTLTKIYCDDCGLAVVAGKVEVV